MSGKEVVITGETSRNSGIEDLMALDVGEGKQAHVMTLKPYTHDRSKSQNALSHVWYAEIAAKLREKPAKDVKGECKLHFGIPILRTDIEFSEMYDRIFKHMDYETKLEIMSTPGLFDVTSMMKTEQMSLYLEQIQQNYADRVQLRFPDEPPGY
jgi:hypothetical protein